ncbi:hypothetical protein [Bradyrhizobium sp. 76]|jgi:hypothetical protein|uniref:hypothetical protein n=1 Tax=Bradyrhizobium sp. 76 TaxID=2782680 RepID=UPI001FF8EBDC|nr:hypothetical protein [Bradyrhizobium sp. 76]MCK1404425.1 hypothetical protein [Bradyrhizobium sp. 76]
MRFLPTVMHGVADYVVALVVLGLPYIYGMHGTSKAFLLVLGAAALFYSLLTEYELGLLPVIPFRIHLALDKLFAALMLVGSVLIPFPQNSRLVVGGLGVLSFLVVVSTRRDRTEPAPTNST